MKRIGLVSIAALAGILLIGATAFAGCCGGYGQGWGSQTGYGPGYGPGSCCGFGGANVNGPTRSGLPSCCQPGGRYAYQSAAPQAQPGPRYNKPAKAGSVPIPDNQPQVSGSYPRPQAAASYSRGPLRISQSSGPAYSRYPRAAPAGNSSLPPCCQAPQQSRKPW